MSKQIETTINGLQHNLEISLRDAIEIMENLILERSKLSVKGGYGLSRELGSRYQSAITTVSAIAGALTEDGMTNRQQELLQSIQSLTEEMEQHN